MIFTGPPGRSFETSHQLSLDEFPQGRELLLQLIACTVQDHLARVNPSELIGTIDLSKTMGDESSGWNDGCPRSVVSVP
jgi:hypothetical protein